MSNERAGAQELDRQATRFALRHRAMPSTFIWSGLALEGLGAVAMFLGIQGLESRDTTYGQEIGGVTALAALVLLILGSILIPVGIIRWAIWPLIEKADERD